MGAKRFEIDTEAMKKEIMEELVRREIIMGIEEDEIDLFELFKVLFKHWRLVLVLPLVISLLTGIYSLTIPNQYKSTASIFVHGKNRDLSSVLGNLSGIVNISSGQGGSSAEYLLSLLNSSQMKKEIIKKFGIATSPHIFGSPLPLDLNPDEVMKKFSEVVSVDKDRDGLLTISAETSSASFSAEIVDGYLVNLASFAKGPALEKRIFVEAQLKKISKELEQAEIALKTFHDKNRMINFDIQTRSVVERLVELEAKQIESDIQLKMGQSLLKATEELGKADIEVSLEAKKIAEQARQEAIGNAISEAEGSLMQLPEIYLQYSRLKRDLMVKEKVFTTLTEQFELAKINEAEEGSNFEIVDRPSPAFLKSKPRRSIMVILSWLSSSVLCVFIAFLIEFINKRKQSEHIKNLPTEISAAG